MGNSNSIDYQKEYDKITEQINELTNENLYYKKIIDQFEESERKNKKGHEKIIDIYKKKADLDYKNLVFEGGGVKGICYCGVVQILEELNILKKINKFAGSSAGSIIASLLAIGYTANELKDIMFSFNFNDLIKGRKNYLRDGVRLIHSYGMCDGDDVMSFLGKLFLNKVHNVNYTFENLFIEYGKMLVITVTDINNLRTEYISHLTHPKMPIRKAIRMSLSIPYLFEPVKMNNNLYVDGGLLDNYPIHVFDGEFPGDKNEKLNLIPTNPHTLGIKIIVPDEEEDYQCHKREKIENLEQFSESLIDTLMVSNSRRYIKPGYWERSIPIHVQAIPLFKFKLNKEEKEALYKNGIDGTKKYFKLL